MNTEENGTIDLDALVDEKITGDTEFQATLADMSEEDKATAIETKRKEVLTAEISAGRKNGELAENYKIRAEKAELLLKGKKPPTGGAPATEPANDEPTLSYLDNYALTQANVQPEDVEEVVKASKLLNKSIPETLKDETFLAVLKDRVEKRATANATNTRTQRPTTGKVSDEEVLKQASEGKIPKPGTPEAEALYRARRGIK